MGLVRDCGNDEVKVYYDGVLKDTFTTFFATDAIEGERVLVGNDSDCATANCITLSR